MVCCHPLRAKYMFIHSISSPKKRSELGLERYEAVKRRPEEGKIETDALLPLTDQADDGVYLNLAQYITTCWPGRCKSGFF